MSAMRTLLPPVQPRTVLLVSPDADLRRRLAGRLESMRWVVRAAGGGAEAIGLLQDYAPEAMIVDHWLPDLDPSEFAEHAASLCAGTDLLHMDGTANPQGQRSVRRNELLHALREIQDDGIATVPRDASSQGDRSWRSPSAATTALPQVLTGKVVTGSFGASPGAVGLFAAPMLDLFPLPAAVMPQVVAQAPPEVRMHLPEVVGDAVSMRDLARMVRLGAGHRVCVLIQGETGTGKELVAKAVHRLSPRAGKPFVVLNCAAIPEHLLEAELFGHTRGAFTGAVNSRTGRIEAAHGGTLFLDEIGEMPISLQAKMLRFLESGEIQRVGENEMSHVDVRIVAATHQPLERNAADKLFRLDLYYRLAVFPVDVPALRDRRDDIPMLTEFFLRRFGEDAPRCSIDQRSMERLMRYDWPGNVRQLGHMLQRACILTGGTQRIGREHLNLPEA